MNPFNSFLNSAYNYIKISVLKGFKKYQDRSYWFCNVKETFCINPIILHFIAGVDFCRSKVLKYHYIPFNMKRVFKIPSYI